MTAVAGGERRIGVMALALNVGRCYGGAERIAFELLGRLNPDRFARSLCVINVPLPGLEGANEADLRELEEDGVEVLRLERRSQFSLSAWSPLYRRLAAGSIDILHCHMPRASLPGTIVGRLARVPVIVNHEHGWAFEGQPVRQFLDRNVLARGGNVLLAVSERDRHRMIELERIPAECIEILPNGIVASSPSGHDVRGELGLASDARLVGAIARLFPEKGNDELIRAMALLKPEQGGQLQCVIAGLGPEDKRLQALIDELDLADCVRLVGFRTDVPDLLRALDVAVLASKREGSPLAVMEYMAASAPIVATAVGGVPELIEDGVHGLLVRPGDPRALANAIGRLLDDRTLAARLGAAAAERQHATYDVEVVVRQLEDLYVRLFTDVCGTAPPATLR